jgi:hypothetical protein
MCGGHFQASWGRTGVGGSGVYRMTITELIVVF